MPSKNKSSKRCMLRVTDVDGSRREQYVNVLMKRIVTFAVREVGGETEKPHYHSIHLSGKTTLYDRATVKLSWKGNENHAFTMLNSDSEEDWDECMKYLCKGPDKNTLPEVVINTFEYTDEQIQEWHDLYWKEGMKKKASDDGKKKKLTEEDKQSMFNKKLMYCKEHGITHMSTGWEICDMIQEYYAERCVCRPGDFQLRAIVQSIHDQLKYEQYVNATTPAQKQIWLNYRTKRSQSIIGNTWVD